MCLLVHSGGHLHLHGNPPLTGGVSRVSGAEATADAEQPLQKHTVDLMIDIGMESVNLSSTENT